MATSTDADRRRAGTVEIAHAWADGDGRKPLDSLLDEYRDRSAGSTLTDTFYDDLSLSVKSRILAEDPPSIWVEWPGESLRPYADVDALRDLTDVWTDTDMESGYLDGPRELSRIEGSYRAIPINIHRINNLFYRTAAVDRLGIDPASVSDPREFLEVLEICDEAGELGMAQPMKNPWTVLQLFSMILTGQFGVDVYRSITDGNPHEHRGAIETSIELLDAYADLASDDATFVGMVGANRRFLDGESVFFHQGDWVGGEYADVEDFDYREDWDHVPFPGTDGVYAMGMDAFVAASTIDESDWEATREFLEFAGSPTGLRTFNRIKGAIPPRGDVSLDAYPPFLQDQYQDFQASREQVGSDALETHPERFIEAKAAIASFVTHRDVSKAVGEFVEAYE
ncbi:ABC transporter substrate-binding protein [Halococcoides cellulosivorans]|uniref:ABC transporter substrate-binding protein n=1 Tax=Halococcoides cellulosivorans TaxID=1679096 RepID=A0A2R4X0Q5_9EURY|nr:ABC transporter substrate-binding protein [Halococcoides cellulosivorans]AWB27380.1 ABC transporter substrate-binding protein [Halococcoides cellulosivorans]